MIVKDQLQRKLQFKKPPKRIVSLVPSLTELIVDLGLEKELIGVTKFCVHPKHLRHSKAIVGGTKQIKLDKIKDLQPDVILCNKEENTQEIIEQLQAVSPIHISDINTLDDCYELIEMYGGIFNKKEKVTHLISTIKKEREHFQTFIENKPQKSVAYFIWKDPWMIAASGTFISCMLQEAGFKNGFSKEARYPEITLDDPRLLKADIIFLSSEPYPFKEEHVKMLKSHFPNIEIKIVDGELFSWYGSRLTKAFTYFRSLY
ncbi:ABC transporter substrate-binding protein [Winogradskyella sp. A3E31]|uniref:ABC transporter substrate-binding protein n=1 Tax=Winogradskyella sp. A3E31 TaxID=3349637 RepID=UPI00398A789B